MTEDFTPEEARRRMIRRMRLDADEEGEEEEQTRESEGGESGGSEKPHYGNTRLPFGLCKRFGIDLPADAKPRDAWEALEKGTGYTHDEIMDTVKKVGDTKGLKTKKETADKTTGGKQGSVREKGAGVKDPKSLRGMGAREHKHFNTVSEGQSYLSKELGVPVNYMGAKGMTAEKANKFNDAILTVADEIGIKPDAIDYKNLKKTYMYVEWRGVGTAMGPLTLKISNTYFNESETDPEEWHDKMLDNVISCKDDLQYYKEIGDKHGAESKEKELKKAQEEAKYKVWRVAKPGADMESEAFHEIGHVLMRRVEKTGKNTALITAGAFVQATKKKEDGSKDIHKISRYAKTKKDEFFAECFASYMLGIELPDYCNKMVEDMISELGKGKEE